MTILGDAGFNVKVAWRVSTQPAGTVDLRRRPSAGDDRVPTSTVTITVVEGLSLAGG